MAATPGKTGAIFYRKAWIQGTGLALVDSDPDTITDTGSGFVTAGFQADDLITVAGTANNNTNYTIDTGGVAAGTLTLIAGDTVTAEGAGNLVTVQEALPGTQALTFFNWSIDQAVDMLEVTSFEHVGIETFIAGIRRWTGRAGKFFNAAQLAPESWLGEELMIRFFYLYDAAPNVTTVYYLQGNCFVSGINPTAVVAGVVEEEITFQGTAKASMTGTGIAFVDSDPDTLTDTGSQFIVEGFEAGDKITVAGSTSNDGDYTIASVAAGTITLITTDSLTAEIAGDTVSITSEVRLTTGSVAWPT